jgi:hypothetical protein
MSFEESPNDPLITKKQTGDMLRQTEHTVSINDPRNSGNYEVPHFSGALDQDDVDEKDAQRYPRQDPPAFEWNSLNQNL